MDIELLNERLQTVETAILRIDQALEGVNAQYSQEALATLVAAQVATLQEEITSCRNSLQEVASQAAEARGLAQGAQDLLTALNLQLATEQEEEEGEGEPDEGPTEPQPEEIPAPENPAPKEKKANWLTGLFVGR